MIKYTPNLQEKQKGLELNLNNYRGKESHIFLNLDKDGKFNKIFNSIHNSYDINIIDKEGKLKNKIEISSRLKELKIEKIKSQKNSNY